MYAYIEWDRHNVQVLLDLCRIFYYIMALLMCLIDLSTSNQKTIIYWHLFMCEDTKS